VLERLLRCSSTDAHEKIAGILWDATSDATAVQQLTQLADEELLHWEQAVEEAADDSGKLDALATG
jgi:hypothetical protein